MAPFDVVAFDLDGTLLRGTTVSVLTAEWVGRGAESAELERRYVAGEISNAVIADAAAGWLSDEALGALDDAPFIDGIAETVAALRDVGCLVLVATITWRSAAERVAARFGFDAVCGTEVAGGAVRVCDEHDKAAFVVGECERRGIPLERLAAVGDSRSDLPLFARAGLAIALNADAQARAAADVVVDAEDLRDLLPLLLPARRTLPTASREAMALAMRQLTTTDAPAVVALRDANREHFLMGEPRHGEEWFTVAAQERWIADDGIAFGAFDGDALVAYARLSQIVRGGFQNAYLGYAVDARRSGHGIATALVRHCVAFAFGELGLHRVQANVRTDNPASQRVLVKAGFRREGLALRYLRIDGEWRDHDMFALTAEEL